MKRNTIAKSALAAALLCSAAFTLRAQEAPARECPWGHPPGYGRSLTPEERAAQCAAREQYIVALREKQAQGSLTAEEQALLQRLEAPRGPGHRRGPAAGAGYGPREGGKGYGAAQGGGQRRRQGLRDGTGPRAENNACPAGQPPSPPPRGRR